MITGTDSSGETVASRWRYDDDRTYHGFYDHADERGGESPAWIEVELPEFGSTEREGVQVLRAFNENPHYGKGGMGPWFGWGYNGGAPVPPLR